jgi:hypothetical protein
VRSPSVPSSRTLGDVMIEPVGVRRVAVSGRGRRRSVLSERARRTVFGVLFVLAVAGAAGLMGSALVEDAGPRAALQIAGAVTAVGFGAAASVLAWRWWGGRVDR